MNKVVQGVVGLGLLCISAAPAVAATDVSKLPVVTQELVAPPFVPKHDQVAKGGPKVVKIRMETIEKLVDVAPDGTKMWALTFNGTVPGPLIVVHEGDYVELALESHQAWRICLSLRPRRHHDPVSRHLRHEWSHHGIAARRPEGCQGQACAL